MLVTASSVDITLGPVTVTLLPSKAVWCGQTQTLFIADTHFGKAATMRRSGLPIPAGTTGQTLQRLSQVLEETNAQRLVILGDLIHSRVSAQADFETDLRAWRKKHAVLPVLLIKGNHDRRENSFYEQLQIETVCEPHDENGLQLCHDVRLLDGQPAIGFGGHIHPGVMIRALSSKPLPCFYRQVNALTLPAFGSFTGCARVRPGPEETCYAVSEGLVIEIDHETPFL